MGNTRTIGILAERIAANYLKKHGFCVTAMNYRAKRGEIDIIAGKSGETHFFEVKSSNFRSIRPEENVDGRKIKKIRSAIKKYLSVHRHDENSFHFHVIIVHLCKESRRAEIEVIKDVIV